jgi:hypothetical protein
MTFVTTYKQADLTLTGTMRKAQLAATATKTSRHQKHQPTTTASPPPSLPDGKRRPSELSSNSGFGVPAVESACEQCRVRFSPVWWDSEDGGVLCHKCHWGKTHGAGEGVNGQEGGLANGVEAGGLVGIAV